MSSPNSKGIVCGAYIGFLRLYFKKEHVNFEFRDNYQLLKKLALPREDMLILMPYAMMVDFVMG